MKLYVLLFFCAQFLISCAQFERNPNSISKPIKHIVFDIDWTIVAKVEANSNFSQRVVNVGDEKYFIYDGVETMIEKLLDHPEVRVSFFSGGSKERNHQLLKLIKLSNGKSLEDISYKILNYEDLNKIEKTSDNDTFAKRYKKDLKKISNDLTNLVMVDDTEHFVLNVEQEDHVLTLGPTFKHFEKYSDAKIENGPYIPKSYSEWSYAEKKLILVDEALNEAIEQSDQSDIALSEAMNNQKKLLDFNSGEWNDYTRNLYLLRSNLQLMNCYELFVPFFNI